MLEVAVREGDTVTAGQPLVTLEKGDLPAQRLIAAGQLAQAEGALEKVDNRNLSGARRAEIDGARARLRAQEAARSAPTTTTARRASSTPAAPPPASTPTDATLALRSSSAQAASLQAQLDSVLQGTPQEYRAAQGVVDAARGRVSRSTWCSAS